MFRLDDKVAAFFPQYLPADAGKALRSGKEGCELLGPHDGRGSAPSPRTLHSCWRWGRTPLLVGGAFLAVDYTPFGSFSRFLDNVDRIVMRGNHEFALRRRMSRQNGNDIDYLGVPEKPVAEFFHAMFVETNL